MNTGKITISLLFIFSMCLSLTAFADVQLTNIRKLAVFPIGNVNSTNGEEAWWQMRESLTRDQRFFVASRRFMVNRGVFHSRMNLKPSDVIILGKILESQSVLISYVKDRKLFAVAYDSENGFKLWESEYLFHPVLPINDQIIAASQKLVEQFLASFPYQSFQVVVDEAKNIVPEEGKNYAYIFSPYEFDLKVGENVQWVHIEADPSFSLFAQGLKVNVVANGQVVEVKDRTAKVMIENQNSFLDFKDGAIVRVPRLEALWKEQFGAQEEKTSKLSYEYLASELSPNKVNAKEHNPTSTALSWIFSMAGFILLAF